MAGPAAGPAGAPSRGGFVPSFLRVLGDLDHGNQSTVGTAFIKSLLTLLCCTNIVMLN